LMNRIKPHQLNYILNNKTLGSAEIVRMLNSYFYSIRNNKPLILKTTSIAEAKLGHFQAINSYLKNLHSCLSANNKSELIKFLKKFPDKEDEKIETIFNKIYPELKKMRSVLTLSRSGTVLGILKLWYKKNKTFKVVVCESRPKLEGRLMANELAAEGIKIKLITDAMMNLYVQNVDAVIIGADTVLSNGNVVNKAGSKALALLCKEYKRPFYVVTAQSKYSRKKTYRSKSENPDEVWDKKVKNLSINNIYFEEIEKKFITKIFTE